MKRKTKRLKSNVQREKGKPTLINIPKQIENEVAPIEKNHYATPSFAHVARSYKKGKTKNSAKARRGCNAVNKSSSAKRKYGRVNKKKTSSLDSLKVYEPNMEKALAIKDLQKKTGMGGRTFFSGEDERRLPTSNVGKEALVLSATQDLEVIDDIEGFHLTDGNGVVVCRMLPRKVALRDQQNLVKLNNGLIDLNNSAKRTLVRGGQRIVGLPDNDEEAGKYNCVGLSPSRNSKGLYEKWPKEIDKRTREVLQKMFNRVNDKIKQWIEKHLLIGFEKMMFGNECVEEIEGGIADGKNILVAGAIGKGSYLNSHTDHDAFLSVYTGHCREAIDESTGNYPLECKPIGYFCFPDQGACVALRPGDILIFNAQKYNHCNSSPVPINCVEEPVYNISLYLKTAVMAGNSN